MAIDLLVLKIGNFMGNMAMSHKEKESGLTAPNHVLCGFGLSILLSILVTFQAPGAAPASDPLPPPAFSHPGGFYDTPFNLIISTIEGAAIYYTLDGSEPDPENLDGISFQYKNEWVHKPGDTDGELLTCLFFTMQYDSPIPVTDRSGDNDRLSRKASTFYNPPWYFPDSTVFKGTVVKAIAVRAGNEPSPVVTHTYFVHPRARERYTLPVISISTPESHLFDYETGIYTPGAIFDEWRQRNPEREASGGTNANYWQRGDEWEVPARLSFWDTGSNFPDLDQDVGLRVHGGWSRSLPMKSLRIYARNQYGESVLSYPFFPDQDYPEYKRLVLRNSGNDNIYTLFRDALIHRVSGHMNMETQAYRPAVVFLNGEYWGIHNIRERYDKHYFKRVYGIDEEYLELMTGRFTIKEGDGQHYQETLRYIEENSLSHTEHYEYIKTRIDTENFIDYQVANIFASNIDWPGNNIDYWRKRIPEYDPDAGYGHDGRWRWMAFDMDFGFGLYTSPADHNTMEFAAASTDNGWSNPLWSTFLLRSFLENGSFRNNFINRFAGQLNTAFLPSRVDSLISLFSEALKPELPDHFYRWKRPYDMEEWHFHVTHLRNFAKERPGYQWGHLMDYFDLDTVSVTLSVSSPHHGYIRINDIDITPSTPGVAEDPYPWRGTYFSGVPVTFEAVPLEGYRFSHWEGVSSDLPVITADPSEISMITAHFVPDPKMNIIHLWHFNDLQGDEMLQAVTADYSAVEAGDITYPGEGAGYMDRVADGSTVNLQEGFEPGYGLRARNPSHTRQLLFSLPSTGFDSLTLSYATKKTNNGAWNQSVYASADSGGSWIQVGETIVVSENWQRVLFNLSGFPQLGDNPAMKVKILFGGETAPGESGNNRFDNITLRGRFLHDRLSYYNKPAGSLNEPDSWGTEPDGSGQAPASFDMPGAVYHIHNGGQVTISGDWEVSGMLSGVVLGGGGDPVIFIIPPDYYCSGPMDVGDDATLVIQNAMLPDLKEVFPLSTVVFQQQEAVTIPARHWGSLHLKAGQKALSGDYLVRGSFRAEDAGLSFEGPTRLTLEGDLEYTGIVTTRNPENVTIIATGPAHQLFWAGGENLIQAYNFYIEKTEGTFTTAANIHATNNLRLDFSGSSLFTDGGHTLQLGDDLSIRGDGNNFDLSGTIFLSSSGGTNDMEITVPLNNLVIDATGDARVDFNDAAPVIWINNDLVIRSRSLRPVRLRDKRFNIMGNLLLDMEEPGQTEQGESFLVFGGERMQVLENAGYGGPGLLHGLVIDGAGLRLEGSVTADRLIGFENGTVHTAAGKLLKLGAGGTIAQSSPDSYVNGPMGVYNNSTEPVTMEFPVGKEGGLQKVILEAEHRNNNLRLYTAEFFEGVPPLHPLGSGIAEILESHGWYSIESDNRDEPSVAAITLAYDINDPVFSHLLSIALVDDDLWIDIGGETDEDGQGTIRSTFDFTGTGIFSLARKMIHPGEQGGERVIPVFPNPVFENGTVFFSEIMDVILVNSAGIILLSKDRTGHLDLNGIPPGIYLIRNPRGQGTRLIILEK
jgi:hypothetical protein